MTFEKISSEKFKAFEKSEISALSSIIGGAIDTNYNGGASPDKAYTSSGVDSDHCKRSGAGYDPKDPAMVGVNSGDAGTGAGAGAGF